MDWMGEMSVPITSASGYSSAKSLGLVRMTYKMQAFTDRKRTWPRDLTMGELSASHNPSGSRARPTSSSAYVKDFLKYA